AELGDSGIEREAGAGGGLVEDHGDRPWPLERAGRVRLGLELEPQVEHLGLFCGAQVVVAEDVPNGRSCRGVPGSRYETGHDEASFSDAVSRIAGSADTNRATCSSVRTSGGARRITSGPAAPTRNPAARAAASTSFARDAVRTTPSRSPRPRT